MPHLINVIEQDEGQLEQTASEGNQFTGLDDSDDEEENGNFVLHVRTALLGVKKGAITALGEMAAHTSTNFCPYLEDCMQVLQEAATPTKTTVSIAMRHSVPMYVCCERIREHVTGNYQAILQPMGSIFNIDPNSNDAAAACLDNAAAAVAHMIMASPTHVPMAQVSHVFLRALPLKTDMTENETVYKCLLGLVQMNHPDAMKYPIIRSI